MSKDSVTCQRCLAVVAVVGGLYDDPAARALARHEEDECPKATGSSWTFERSSVPDALFDPPPCPIPGCEDQTSVDDYGEFRCEACAMSWRTDGRDGCLDEIPRCGAIGTSLTLRFAGHRFHDVQVRRVCHLPIGHVEFGRSHAGYDPTVTNDTWSEWDMEETA